ncbi:type II secretion system F family protein [Tundrisphaera lichenicola]|uniref:type II secretion system F family protein n=1 Tax=Tundrisphaera lichenicola TaxID=2029860 RepID=UPI003EBBC1E5
MAKFRYGATDTSGKWISGESIGESREAVEADLNSRGLAVESLVEAEDFSGSRLSRSDTSEFVEQLASLTRSGLPLPSGLRAAAAEVNSPELRRCFNDLVNRIEAGQSLDRAIAEGRSNLPGHLLGLIMAGSRSGRVSEILSESVRNANLGDDLRRKFWTIVAYPAATLLVVVALVIFVCNLSTQASDAVSSNLEGFGFQKTGIQTQAEALSSMAQFVVDHWLHGLVGFLTIGAVILGGIRLMLSPAQRWRMACDVPIVGPVLRYTSLTEFCRLMAMLLEAEIPLPEALELAGRGVQDAELAEASERMARAIYAGDSFTTAIRLWDVIPSSLSPLFRWSEGRGSLPGTLRLAGELFEARARSQSAFSANVLNTILALLILWLVGFAIATLYLPLFSLINLISALSG